MIGLEVCSWEPGSQSVWFAFGTPLRIMRPFGKPFLAKQTMGTADQSTAVGEAGMLRTFWPKVKHTQNMGARALAG